MLNARLSNVEDRASPSVPIDQCSPESFDDQPVELPFVSRARERLVFVEVELLAILIEFRRPS